MTNSATEQTEAYVLTWSLTVVDDQDDRPPALRLAYQVEASEELYLEDRLWVYDDARQRAPDPYGVYRFVERGALWLVFAQAPWPPEVAPRIVYSPLSSRVRAGETHRGEAQIALPVDEYSALARDVDSQTELEQVSRVTLVLGYRLRSTMDADPLPPPHESPAQAGYIVHDHALIVSSLDVEPLPVKRRTGPISRFSLPTG